MPLFFHLTHFRELGQEYKNIFVRLLVQMKTLNFAFEIKWPLVFVQTMSSELIETLVYFITLCHGWPCRGCHRERRALGWKIHLNACLTVTRFKWNNIIVLMACLWLYCTVHNGVKLFMESYKVQVFWEGHINPELFFN